MLSLNTFVYLIICQLINITGEIKKTTAKYDPERSTEYNH